MYTKATTLHSTTALPMAAMALNMVIDVWLTNPWIRKYRKNLQQHHTGLI